jgi:hypothetical protein
MIHLFKQKTMQVDKVASDMDGGKLALSIRHHPIAAGKSCSDQHAAVGALPFQHQVLTRGVI